MNVGRGAVWLIVLGMIATGCSRGDPFERVIVSGTVTWKGQPLKEGHLHLYPEAGTEAPFSGSMIFDGRYECNNKGGVAVGDYRVEITAYEEVRTPAPPGDTYEREYVNREQFLPAKFNKKTTLKLSLKPGEKRVTQDFILEP